MAFGHKIRDLIFNSREDNHVCLLGTIGTDGPNISPKGSMMIFDDDHFGLLGAREAIGLKNLEDDLRLVTAALSHTRS